MRSRRAGLRTRKGLAIAAALGTGFAAGTITNLLDLPQWAALAVWLVGIAGTMVVVVVQLSRHPTATRLNLEIGPASSFRTVKVWRHGTIVMSLGADDRRASTLTTGALNHRGRG